MTRRRKITALVIGNLVAMLAIIGLVATQSQSLAAPPVGLPKSRVAVEQVDPEAAGVNEGVKEQASGIKMHAIPKFDPRTTAGKFGQFGGCQPGYGTGNKCLPPASPDAVAMKMTPDEHPWNCYSVHKLFPKGIKLNKKGVDTLKLDFNHDGIACGKGD